ncbi:TPA: PAAR domain-containing protein [Burkholderia vietnamiensis]|uniref:PAAR domain-containing protein n=1 Tax=Burkholderia vietnamiensis TaxID=60552 RepID=A0ABS1B5H3_BURVI|nr:PAAR motif family protein [Burkholderia vietnamiensis LMG 10929]AVR17543.1 PAAR domain-containing protein [Burkholderia vietnamiensis]MBJ9691523.1 PAAR domain-containing protein [Burkholderia vietnamiensis]HDR8935996.1 PAAR domain-containing protein [Burkholderia vietnamiensis]HDR9064511.1 PAAR domain-containing protein [Burkholderia vietnamiensis]
MTYAFIREGDTTSHGGRVLACRSTNMMFGKAVALLGDMVACPKCGGVYLIVDVKVRSMTFDGRPVATEGDKTACGASLIGSQGSLDMSSRFRRRWRRRRRNSPGNGVAVENIAFVLSRRANAVKGCGWTQPLTSFFVHGQIVFDRRNARNTLGNFPCEIDLRLVRSHSY